jgi:phage/plasmid primase-like uncharacterized protein
MAPADPVTQFRDAIHRFGLNPPLHIKTDGKIHRFSSNSTKSDTAGWYVYKSLPVPHGAFGDWRQGFSETWVVNLGRKLTRDEREGLKAAQAKDEAERREIAARARRRATYVWDRAKPAPIDHPYLTAKGVSPYGLRIYKNLLVVPARNIDGELTSLQFISESGEKRFLRGGAVKGSFYTIGSPNDTIQISEGFATSATIYDANGIATVAAFNAGNLDAVAKALKAKYPHEKLIVCADDDWQTDGNPGLAKARTAAIAVDGKLAIPSFGPNRTSSETDFNDLYQIDGLSAVKECLASAREPNSRDELLASEWLKRNFPPRDYLLGTALCTTSRWLVVGDTGIGKTIFAMHLFAAMCAAGEQFLGWECPRKVRAMYLDGEMSRETFKERVEIITQRYGADIEFYGYCRDDLPEGEAPPLNTEQGQHWLWREVKRNKPDIIGFDSVMSLLDGVMSEEQSWKPMLPLIRQITAHRIAQMWLHHTGHDASKSFGTKTREWEMEAVVMLTWLDDDGRSDEPQSAEFRLEFKKARLRNPGNYKQFTTKIVKLTEYGFEFTEHNGGRTKATSDAEIMRRAFIDAYDRLADGKKKEPGFDGSSVIKVPVDAIRDEMKRRGFLALNDKGQIDSPSRKQFQRAKTSLTGSNKSFTENDGLIWRIKTA